MITYLMWAAGEILEAESLGELGELYECATVAGDTIERIRAVERGHRRSLSGDEYAELLELAYAAHQYPARDGDGRSS